MGIKKWFSGSNSRRELKKIKPLVDKVFDLEAKYQEYTVEQLRAETRKFQQKFNLKFTLLADTELEAIKAYDVWKEKNMYGKKSFGVVRTTYLIDEKGIIIKAAEKAKAAENPADTLALF